MKAYIELLGNSYFLIGNAIILTSLAAFAYVVCTRQKPPSANLRVSQLVAPLAVFFVIALGVSAWQIVSAGAPQVAAVTIPSVLAAMPAPGAGEPQRVAAEISAASATMTPMQSYLGLSTLARTILSETDSSLNNYQLERDSCCPGEGAK
jgi:hypothetical protein